MDMKMKSEINYKNNPLHGVSLKKMLMEIVDHYGFEILFAYLNINCFKNNPSIASSVKFLKKTDWAREKVEGFYLYKFKNLPRATSEQFLMSPRDRIIPEGQTPGEPAELSMEDAERLREKRAIKADTNRPVTRNHSKSAKNPGAKPGKHYGRQDATRKVKDDDEPLSSPGTSIKEGVDPWANRRNKSGKKY